MRVERRIMKLEILAHAMEELDDDLLMEAREPAPKRRPVLYEVVRYTAVAACLVLLLTGVFLKNRSQSFPIWVNDIQLTRKECVDIPLLQTAQQRAVTGMEIPLRIGTDGKEIRFKAEKGSVLLDRQGEAHQELIISEESLVWWVVDPTQQTSFELTVYWKNREIRLCAEVTPDEGTLRIKQCQ